MRRGPPFVRPVCAGCVARQECETSFARLDEAFSSVDSGADVSLTRTSSKLGVPGRWPI